MRFNQLLRASRVPIFTIVPICMVFLSLGVARKSGNGPKRQNGAQQMRIITPRVQNQTRSFELIRARQNLDVDKAGPELSLNNRYERNITAFALSVNGLIVMTDFAYSEGQDQRAIAPGAVYTSVFSTIYSVNPAVASREGFNVNVLAVLFDDNTSDGDEKAIAMLRYPRLKSKQLLTRIIDLFDQDLDSPRTTDDSVFNELISRISSLSADPNDSSDTNDVLRWLGQADPRLSPRKRVIGVKETCESLIARLCVFSSVNRKPDDSYSLAAAVSELSVQRKT